MLALGGVDSHVRLYTCPPGGEFGEVCRLSGHQDWVRSLAFARMDDGEGAHAVLRCAVLAGCLCRSAALQVGLPGSGWAPRAVQPLPMLRCNNNNTYNMSGMCCLLADGRLLLASASQDKYVRIWAIQIQGDPPRGAAPATTAAAAAAPAAAVVPDLAQQIARYAPKPRIATPAHSYSATLEALLIGHEDWVHSVAWHPPVPAAGGAGGWAQPPCLLSASMDRSMMLWRPDRATGGRQEGREEGGKGVAGWHLDSAGIFVARADKERRGNAVQQGDVRMRCSGRGPAPFEAACAPSPLRMLSKAVRQHQRCGPRLLASSPILRTAVTLPA